MKKDTFVIIGHIWLVGALIIAGESFLFSGVMLIYGVANFVAFIKYLREGRE